MNSTVAKEPDPDAIKMFVGQIPRSMDEADLRKMFEQFGEVCQLNVLRDKVTGQSKGCCFVTMATRKQALQAQDALHNIKVMAGMHHPVQMKPADSEKRSVEDRKLFVGMISKKLSEQEIRMLFAPFGTIEECTVLRDQNGQSRGCAFVTYSTRQSAQNAIKSMHHSQTMEGCSCPLVVKFADTQKDKEARKIQTLNNNMWPMPASITGLGNLSSAQYLALLQQSAAAGNVGALANMGNLGINSLTIQQVLASAAAASAAAGNTPEMGTLQNLQNLATLASLTNSHGGLNTVASLNQLASNSNGTCFPGISSTGTVVSSSSPVTSLSTGSMALSPAAAAASNLAGSGLTTSDTLTQAYSGIQQYAASFPTAFANQSALQQLQAQSLSGPAGKQTEGPDGGNLFIYHLPQEYSDQELMHSFSPFGNVVSAKVFIDKQTNLSKCFGFVSFDNPLSAQAAIQAMNGFQIGMKRLKVQLKRPKSESKPY